MRRFFHVVYVSDPEIAGCLNAVRMFAEGSIKHPAHITLMGPYSEPRHDAAALSQFVRGRVVRIYSNGTFFLPEQNTVFLKASGDWFLEIWDKPQVSDFVPHLTVYDGGERWYANQIADILARAKIDLSFVASGLDILESPTRADPWQLFDLSTIDLISRIVGRSFSDKLVRASSLGRRIYFIRLLLEHLSAIGPRSASLGRRAIA